MRIRRFLTAVVVTVLVGAFAACSGSSNSDDDATQASSEPLTVIAAAKPHAELIREAQNLGLLDGIDVQISELQEGTEFGPDADPDQIDPDQAVDDGDADANFFQDASLLDDWNEDHTGADLVVVASVHMEPLGLYSKKVNSLAEVPQDAVIAIPADGADQGRALFLLQDTGLVKLDVARTDPDLDYSRITGADVTDNPKNISFVTVDRPQLAATLDDPAVTLSVVNGNYALEAGIVPANSALALEDTEDNPYANVLVTRKTLRDDPRVQELAEALESPELAKYILDTYQGSVLPVNA